MQTLKVETYLHILYVWEDDEHSNLQDWPQSPTSTTTLHERIPDCGGERTATDGEQDPIHPPGFELIFTFSASPQNSTPSTHPPKPYTPPSLSVTKPTKPTQQACHSQPERIYLSSLSHYPTHLRRIPRKPTNPHDSGKGETGASSRMGVTIQSENDNLTPTKRTHPKSEHIDIPKRRCDANDKCIDGRIPGARPSNHNPNEDISLEL